MDSSGSQKKKKKKSMWRDARGIFPLCASCGAMRERARNPTRGRALARSLSLSRRFVAESDVLCCVSFIYFEHLSVIVVYLDDITHTTNGTLPAPKKKPKPKPKKQKRVNNAEIDESCRGHDPGTPMTLDSNATATRGEPLAGPLRSAA